MSYRICEGDCREVLAKMKPDMIDAVVTDPPYGLEFMGKDWDKGVPGQGFWEPLLKVMKPGAHALVFGGTRTHHRLMCALEDAGFEIRDCLMWLYGSGFPKGIDISKAIDKEAGATRKVVGPGKYSDRGRRTDNQVYDQSTCSEAEVATSPATDAAQKWDGWSTALKPAWEPIILARKPLSEKTVAANVLKWGTGGLNIGECRIEGKPRTTHSDGNYTVSQGDKVAYSAYGEGHANDVPDGRWPANLIIDEVTGAMLDAQSGERPVSGAAKTGRRNPNEKDYETPEHIYGRGIGQKTGTLHNDSGGASRFFYCAKASTKERNAGLDGKKNDHPTVKPLALLEYLVKLVTPPDGIVLDPFCGSGSTIVAAQGLSLHQVGMEMQPEYCEIAKTRVEAARELR